MWSCGCRTTCDFSSFACATFGKFSDGCMPVRFRNGEEAPGELVLRERDSTIDFVTRSMKPNVKKQ